MTSYWVSTPFFTVRVDVRDGVIQRSSANYIKRHWGKAWQPWIGAGQEVWPSAQPATPSRSRGGSHMMNAFTQKDPCPICRILAAAQGQVGPVALQLLLA